MQQATVLLALTGGAGCAREDLPAPEALFERHAVAMGHRAIGRKHTSQITRGRVEFDVPEGQFKGTMEVASRAPNLQLATFRIPGVGEAVEGFDGERAWLKPCNGPFRFKHEREVAQLKHHADFYGPLDYREHFPKMKTLWAGRCGGEPGYLVQATTPEGDSSLICFSRLTGLKISTEAQVFMDDEGGDTARATHVGLYQEFDGVKLPTLIELRGSWRMRMVVEEVVFDAKDFPDIRVPPELRNSSMP